MSVLIYENKVPASYRVAFVSKVRQISTQLGIDPNWLMQIINWESAGSFSPSITNSIGATGLIQFMPQTAVNLGVTTAFLRKLTAVQQLDYVYKYYLPYKSKLKSYPDLYLATLFPLALGKGDNFVLQTKSLSASSVAKNNPAFDINKDAKITVGEVKQVMMDKVPQSWKDYFLSSAGKQRPQV